MPPEVLRTPLSDRHAMLHAKMVPFAGWEMPIQYPSGILAEHQAVRTSWGMFDVSHMGRLDFRGAGAGALLDRLLTCDVAGLQDGQASYGFMCIEDGGILDDVVVLRRAADTYLLVCNAGNRDAVVPWIERHTPTTRNVSMTDLTTSTVMLAVQGPAAREKTNTLFSGRIPALKRFYGAEVASGDGQVLVTRTGYTGEDGYELVCLAGLGLQLWHRLVTAGASPCGLGARDTLRLEAGLPLHGQDIDRTTNPIEAGLDRFVHLAGDGFIGKPALESAAKRGVQRTLRGFKTAERGAIPRHGQPVLEYGQPVGHVTSGNFSPSLNLNIGMAYLPVRLAHPGQRLAVDVRGRAVDIEVAPMPFYRRTATQTRTTA